MNKLKLIVFIGCYINILAIEDIVINSEIKYYNKNTLLNNKDNIAIKNNIGTYSLNLTYLNSYNQIHLLNSSNTNIKNFNNGLIKKSLNLKTDKTKDYSEAYVTIENSANINGELKNNTGCIITSINLEAGKNTSNEMDLIDLSAYSTNSGNGFVGRIIKNVGTIKSNLILKGGEALTSGFPNETSKKKGAFAYVIPTNSGNGLNGNIDINKGAIKASGKLFAGNSKTSWKSSDSSVHLKNSLNGILTKSIVSENIGKISSDSFSQSGNAISLNLKGSSNSIVKALNSGNGLNGNIDINKGIIQGNGMIILGKADGSTINYNYINLISSFNGINGSLNKNFGVIRGNLYTDLSDSNLNSENYEKFKNSGNGISVVGDIGDIENLGVIKGSQSAISAGKIGEIGKINRVDNLGILAGREIFSDGVELIKNDSTIAHKNLSTIDPTTENNFGLYIKLKSEMNGNKSTGKIQLDNNGNPIIEQIINGLGGEVTLEDGTHKTVLNGTPVGTIAKPNTVITTGDSFLLSSALPTDKSNLIINGAGIAKGALVVNQNTDLTDSIVNSYNTAVYLEGDKSLIATNAILNGGGLKGDIAVVKGDASNNMISLNGSSIVNGSIDLGAGSDTLNISTETQLNGAINGGLGNDTLGLGNKKGDSLNLNILHDISGFENVVTNGNVALFETVAITDAANINLESGNLTLRVDPTKTIIEDGKTKVIGHALYGNSGNLNSTGGNLVVGLNGLGTDTVISMGGTTISSETNDSWWKDSDHIKTNSLVLDGKISNNGKDINITVKELIDLFPPTINPEPPIIDPPNIIDKALYKKLNEVYKSIVSAGEIGKLANTTLIEDVKGDSYLETVEGETGKTYEEALGGLLTVLDQVYANNPYAYTLKSTRDSLKLFEDNVSYLTIKPKEKQWIVQGKGIYTGVKNDNEDTGRNYYGFDTGYRNFKTTTNTVGGLATFEYGLSDKTSLGFVFGGNNQNINFRGSSSIDGNSLYLGTFTNTEKNNFKFISGLGYQYTLSDVNRGVSNKYDSFKTKEKYNINSFNIFTEGKYVFFLNQGYRFEPKIRLSYYNINQDDINEGYDSHNLTMKVNHKSANTFNIEFGGDLIKTTTTNYGKLNNILSVGIIRSLGDTEPNLHGNILGALKSGDDFEIKGSKISKVSGKIGYNLELEQINGIIYTTGANLEFSQNGNRNYTIQLGMGYKF